MSKQESEKRTSPWKSNPTTSHYTPETPVTVGDHGGRGGTVVDCGHGGHAGCGSCGGCGGGLGGRGHGGGGSGQGNAGPIDEQGHEQGGVHQVWEWSMMSLIHLENILSHHHLVILL